MRLPSRRYDLKLRWLAYIEGLRARRAPPPTCASGPSVVSYSFLAVQINADARGIAWSSVGGSTALAFAVLLLFTLNWRIAALATLTIASIVATVVGLVNVYGWKMGTFEAVCITILVGLCAAARPPTHAAARPPTHAAARPPTHAAARPPTHAPPLAMRRRV